MTRRATRRAAARDGQLALPYWAVIEGLGGVELDRELWRIQLDAAIPSGATWRTPDGKSVSAGYVHHVGWILWGRATREGVVEQSIRQLAEDARCPGAERSVRAAVWALQQLRCVQVSRPSRRAPSRIILAAGGLPIPAARRQAELYARRPPPPAPGPQQPRLYPESGPEGRTRGAESGPEGRTRGAESGPEGRTRGAESGPEGRTRGAESGPEGRTRGAESGPEGRTRGAESGPEGRTRGAESGPEGRTRGAESGPEGRTRGAESGPEGRTRGGGSDGPTDLPGTYPGRSLRAQWIRVQPGDDRRYECLLHDGHSWPVGSGTSCYVCLSAPYAERQRLQRAYDRWEAEAAETADAAEVERTGASGGPPPAQTALGEAILARVEAVVSRYIYRKWFAVLRLREAEDGAVVAWCPTDHVQGWLRQHYLGVLAEAVEAECGEPREVRLWRGAR